MKKLRIILIIFAVIAVLWVGMLITDTVKSQSLSAPVFAKEIRAEADNNRIVYQGLGYTVESEYFTDQYGQSYIGCSEVYLFGKIMISAVIT